ncbi:DUF432 domain-containing protein [Maribellus maritimus]|uniref:DUF432 domain-containing protein n=1 Tax=Maribellus maritimus TaxID=2870838 RepID=UPI001EEA3BE4|nr:DUF432 domain-containing protein [Maribellus maritimus]MCG6186809.1 DUF432 domain-containing protein [Maribellus maritimus]
MSTNEIFGKHQITPGNTKSFILGDSTLWVKREKEGWRLLYKENLSEQDEQPDFSNAEYFQTGKSNSVVLAPALPVKPMVFKGSQLKVSPKQKFTFFLKIPITIQVYYSKNAGENLLKEIPYRRLSDTWFGEPDNGEAAFALGNEYFLNFETVEISPFEAICPVSIFNNSLNTLEIQRQIIRVEHLTLYKNANKIVTSLVQVEYKGQQILSAADYHYSKTYDGEKQDILTKPRNTSSKNLLKINFHFIKNMYKID